MRVVHTINSLRADHGGPSRSVTALCTALARQNVDMEIVTHRRGGDEAAPIQPDDDRVAVHFAEREPGYRAFLPGTTNFAQAIEASVEGDTVVHDHGLWLPSNHAAARMAKRRTAPLVVSPRGMLTEWALGFNQAKKRVAWQLYQRRDLRSAALLHATSTAEADDIRRVGLRQPIALIPNGVDLPPTQSVPLRDGKRQALFLSRLHPVKGLMNLVQAWAQVRPEGWELVLAGPDADGYRAEVERAVQELGIAAETRFTGPVDDADKWDLYRAADLFVLPTFSENFGIVAAEALAAGVPVITTKGAPWQDLETHDCGWWIDIGVEPLTRALAEAVGLTDERRRAMGQRGRSLVGRKYAWSHVAEAMSRVYSWLLERGPRPDCIA